MWSPPGSGELRASVRFERRGAGVNDGGVVRSGWETAVPRRRARLQPLRGGEAVQAARLSKQAAWELTLRLDTLVAEVTEDYRAVNVRTGQAFDIRSILDLQDRGRWLVMTLEENRGDGARP